MTQPSMEHLMEKLRNIDLSLIPNTSRDRDEAHLNLLRIQDLDPKMTSWEQDFIGEMEVRFKHNQPVSDKQIMKLKELWLNFDGQGV